MGKKPRITRPRKTIQELINEGVSVVGLVEYPGYYAGSDGNIYSAWFTGKNPTIKDLLYRLSPGYDGKHKYVHVCLKGRSGNRVTRNVHITVCEAFNFGANPKEFDASHIDGNRLNNTKDNLTWESRSANHQRKKLHGTDDRGLRNKRSKINEMQYRVIKRILEMNTGEDAMLIKDIGKVFGVYGQFITKIKTGYRYAM